MTPSEAIKELNAMDEHGDEEFLHGIADKILCLVLTDAGPEYKAVADAYNAARERVGFWYA